MPGIDIETYDNTRLTAFKRCPRFYFFRHVMHWERNFGGPSLPLTFGQSWHAAMDVMWDGIAHGVPEHDLVTMSYDSFVETWTEAGLPHPDEIDLSLQDEMMPRVPNRALDMLYAYYEKRFELIRSFELISVERSFVVPLQPHNDRLFYVGKIDKTVRPSTGRIRSIDHKTTTSSKKDGTSYKVKPMYLETFSPDAQMDGYNFNMHMTFPDDRVDCWVDVALVHRMDEDFKIVPVERSPQQLDAWLSDTIRWIDKIRVELVELQQCSAHDAYMTAFPKNTNACFDFFAPCPFIDLCKSRPNPLTWDETPPGYKYEVWDPLEHAGNPEVK